MSDYTYDESGHLWPFFVFTLSFIIGIPLTWLLWMRMSAAKAFSRREGPVATYQSDRTVAVGAEKKSFERKQRNLGLIIAVALLWGVMAYMLYLIRVTPAPANKLYNPYDILGISEVWTSQPSSRQCADLSV